MRYVYQQFENKTASAAYMKLKYCNYDITINKETTLMCSIM